MLLTILALAAAQPAAVVERRFNPRPAPRGEALLRTALTQGHDRARDAARVARLAWDDRLAADALGYARVMARTGRFEHAAQQAQGENLWMGTRGAYRYDEMVRAWSEEIRNVKAGRIPDVTRTGQFNDVGHFLQMIWPTTTRYGCGIASNRDNEYLVCRYAQPGNIVGWTVMPGRVTTIQPPVRSRR